MGVACGVTIFHELSAGGQDQTNGLGRGDREEQGRVQYDRLERPIRRECLERRPSG